MIILLVHTVGKLRFAFKVGCIQGRINIFFMEEFMACFISYQEDVMNYLRMQYKRYFMDIELMFSF